jgi:uncharacterized protein (UPF0332 family)
MKRELVLAEWRRAQQAMGSAQLLTREGYHADAIGRTYYALFHAAKAALHVQDVSADTHTGVRRMFGLHLIKPGQIEPEWSSPLGETFDERLAADYDPEMSFSARDARAACRQARAFVGRIRRYLRDNGFTASQLRSRRRKNG